MKWFIDFGEIPYVVDMEDLNTKLKRSEKDIVEKYKKEKNASLFYNVDDTIVSDSLFFIDIKRISYKHGHIYAKATMPFRLKKSTT